MASVLLCIYCEDQIKDFDDHVSFGYSDNKHSKCDDCDLTIPNQQCLESHKMLVHQISQRVYNCEKCNIDFSSKTYLMVHRDLGHRPTNVSKEVKTEIEEIDLTDLEIKSEILFDDTKINDEPNNEPSDEISDEPSEETNDKPKNDLNFTCHICEKTHKRITELRAHYENYHGGYEIAETNQLPKIISSEKVSNSSDTQKTVHGVVEV